MTPRPPPPSPQVSGGPPEPAAAEPGKATVGQLLAVWVWLTMDPRKGPPESLPPLEAVKHLRRKNVCPDLDERTMAEVRRAKRPRFQPTTKYDAEKLETDGPEDEE